MIFRDIRKCDGGKKFSSRDFECMGKHNLMIFNSGLKNVWKVEGVQKIVYYEGFQVQKTWSLKNEVVGRN